MPQNRNNRKGEERSETLIIPHITKDMLEKARTMAAQGASRAEIEQAIAAMQAEKNRVAAVASAASAPAQEPEPEVPKPAAKPSPSRSGIIPSSRPRYSAAERRAMLEEVQRRQAEREAARREEAIAEEAAEDHRHRAAQVASALSAPALHTPPKPAETPAEPAARKPRMPQGRKISQRPQASALASDATRTVQVPPVQKPAPAPEAESRPQTAPTHTAAPAQSAPKRQETVAVPRSGPPRNRNEAEAVLNERIRSDHIWLSNPVLVRGLGLAPVVGAALDGKRALMLCVAALILVTFTRVLAVAVCHITKNHFRPVIYCYSAALLYIPTYILLYHFFGADLSLLGIYLPILVVEPAIVKRMEFTELEPMRDAFRHGFNNALGMCVALLLVGSLRELLATGAVFGHQLMHNAMLPLAALPAGGFVILGVLAALWCAVVNLYTDYKHEEVRRLYADRKH